MNALEVKPHERPVRSAFGKNKYLCFPVTDPGIFSWDNDPVVLSFTRNFLVPRYINTDTFYINNTLVTLLRKISIHFR